MNTRTRAVSIAVASVVALSGAVWAIFGGSTSVAGEAVAGDANTVYTPPPTALEQAVSECSAGEIRDGGHTLILDMYGETTYGEVDYGTGSVTVDDIGCVLDALDTPASATSRMESTRALDGMREFSWDEFTASWTYHPDHGLDIILTETT